MFAINAEFCRWEMGDVRIEEVGEGKRRRLNLGISKYRKCNGASAVATGTGSLAQPYRAPIIHHHCLKHSDKLKNTAVLQRDHAFNPTSLTTPEPQFCDYGLLPSTLTSYMKRTLP